MTTWTTPPLYQLHPTVKCELTSHTHVGSNVIGNDVSCSVIASVANIACANLKPLDAMSVVYQLTAMYPSDCSTATRRRVRSLTIDAINKERKCNARIQALHDLIDIMFIEPELIVKSINQSDYQNMSDTEFVHYCNYIKRTGNVDARDFAASMQQSVSPLDYSAQFSNNYNDDYSDDELIPFIGIHEQHLNMDYIVNDESTSQTSMCATMRFPPDMIQSQY